MLGSRHRKETYPVHWSQRNQEWKDHDTLRTHTNEWVNRNAFFGHGPYQNGDSTYCLDGHEYCAYSNHQHNRIICGRFSTLVV